MYIVAAMEHYHMHTVFGKGIGDLQVKLSIAKLCSKLKTAKSNDLIVQPNYTVVFVLISFTV